MHLTPEKYQVAREFKRGSAGCLLGQAVGPERSAAWIEGYVFAQQNLKPRLHAAVQAYIVKLGFKPLCTLEAMRT